MINLWDTLENVKRPSKAKHYLLAVQGSEVILPSRTLYALKQLKRVKPSAVAWLSANVLHVRWGTGGLNLKGAALSRGDTVEALACASASK